MADYCTKEHHNNPRFEELPFDQGGGGRHRCAACAYERGFEAGKKRSETPVLDFDTLPKSQAGNQRHKSPHAAWALGYLDGVRESYK
jgi:hypothetical protein